MTHRHKSVRRGRDAKTGQWIPVREARQRKSTAIVENVPLPRKRKK